MSKAGDPYGEVKARLTAGAHREALDLLSAFGDIRAGDPHFYRLGFEALSGAAWEPDGLAEKYTALCRRLLHQEGCAERPLIFHHGVASLLTAGESEAARSVVTAILPVLRAESGNGSPDRPLLQLLLVARGLLPEGTERAAIRGWHLEAFPGFDAADLILPYSVMFRRGGFEANRDDLLTRFPTGEAIRDPSAALGLHHVLLLDWLGAPSPFGPDDALHEMLTRRLGAANGPALVEERRAARSLLLRHWRPETGIGRREIEALGLEGQVLEAATQVERRAAPTPSRARPEQRVVQASAAVRGLAARAAPFLARRDRALRVAVCVSGQLRGFERALATWRQHLLGSVDADIFVHSWQRIGQAGAQPFRVALPFEGDAFCAAWRYYSTLEGYDAMRRRYPALFDALEAGGRATEEAVRVAYGARAVVLDDEDQPPFASMSNQDKMHYKISAAQALADATGSQYDLVLRIRPDFGVRLRAFDWTEMARACRDSGTVWTDHILGVHYGQPMIGDQIALGAPDAMRVYASAWTKYPALARLDLAHAPTEFVGHLSLAQTLWLNRLETRRLPLRSAGLFEAKRLSVRAVFAALERDAEGRASKVDRALMDAARVDLGANDS